MSDTRLQAVVSAIRNLPTLPTVITWLMQVVENPASSATDVSRVVASDQALLSKVLRVVNSAFYGLPRRVSTLTQATVVLGMNAIKNMAMSVTIFDIFRSDADGSELFSREQFWNHSLAVAAAGKVLARHLRYPVPEEAFSAGLIHDIGKVAIDQYLHPSLLKIMKHVRDDHLSLRQAEIKVLGVDHAELGSWIAERWNLPVQLVEAIGTHHDPAEARRAPKLTAMVALADDLARSEKLGFGGDNLPLVVHSCVWDRLKITEDEALALIPEIRVEYEKTNVFLNLSPERDAEPVTTE
jgi:putative nucleotidyltransferase with HDIG domain